MSGKEKKDYLMRYQNCERAIARVEDELERWRSRAEWATTSYQLAPAHTSGEDRMQSAICQIAELRGELFDRLTDAAAVRREIQQAIGSVEDEKLRLLLEYRYVDAMTFDQIAREMSYSWRQITNLHNKAIEEIKIK